jgi:hypothetical protein
MAYTGIARTNVLLDVTGLAGAASGAGTALQVPLGAADDRMYVAVQASITGTLNVLVQGRADSTAPWVTLYTFTASDSQMISRSPQMRVSYNGASAGAAGKVWLDVHCKPAL